MSRRRWKLCSRSKGDNAGASPKPRDAMSVVVITGASRGIGAATARLAAERGHDVCVNFRANEAAAGAVVAEVRALGQKAIAVQADVASEDSRQRCPSGDHRHRDSREWRRTGARCATGPTAAHGPGRPCHRGRPRHSMAALGRGFLHHRNVHRRRRRPMNASRASPTRSSASEPVRRPCIPSARPHAKR